MTAIPPDELALRLRELHDALQVARRQSRKMAGWQQLQRQDAEGLTASPRPYTPDAITTFTAALERNEDDPDLLHHLAIAHHARAWDLELQGSPQAFAAWEEALTYWRLLQTCPAFWQRLRHKGLALDPGFDPGVVDAARQHLSMHLLEIHLDFIRHYYDQGRVQQAEHHIRLVRRAPLPPAVRKQMDQRLYEAMTGSVPTALAGQQYEAAATAVERFLQLFPHYLVALQQIIEIYQQWVAQTSARDQWEQVESLQARVRPWATRLAAHAELATTPLARLALAELAFAVGDKYRTRARSFRTQRHQDQHTVDAVTVQPERQACNVAIAWFAIAWQHDPSYQDSLVGALLHRGSLITDVGLAVEDSQQREQLLTAAAADHRQALEVAPADFDALYMMAQLLWLRRQSDEAGLLAEQALAVAEQHADAETVAVAQRLLKQIRLQPLLDQAMSHMQQESFANALPLLDQAVQLCPQAWLVFFRRAECQMKLGNIDAAEADCVSARTLASSTEESNAIQELQDMLEHLRQRAQEFGSVAAFRLYQQALRCYEQDDYDGAIEKLRAAIAQGRPATHPLRQLFTAKTTNPVGKLAEGLAICLNARAVQKMEQGASILQGQSRQPRDALGLLREAETDLAEAQRLGAADSTVQHNLKEVQALISMIHSR
jgi:tetratricopeptide (TPR) repeat protein